MGAAKVHLLYLRKLEWISSLKIRIHIFIQQFLQKYIFIFLFWSNKIFWNWLFKKFCLKEVCTFTVFKEMHKLIKVSKSSKSIDVYFKLQVQLARQLWRHWLFEWHFFNATNYQPFAKRKRKKFCALFHVCTLGSTSQT